MARRSALGAVEPCNPWILTPWLPELFSGGTVARHAAGVPYFAGLMSGDTGALVGSFACEPELHHPQRGRVMGAAASSASRPTRAAGGIPLEHCTAARAASWPARGSTTTPTRRCPAPRCTGWPRARGARRERTSGVWSTTSKLDLAGVMADAVWDRAYADVSAWPCWNEALAAADLAEPFEVGARARVRFKTGLRLRFTLVEVEPGRLFTDESRLPGARMGHRHEIERTTDGVRLTNTIYIVGPLARLWSPILGPPARRGLPGWQRRIGEVAAER